MRLSQPRDRADVQKKDPMMDPSRSRLEQRFSGLSQADILSAAAEAGFQVPRTYKKGDLVWTPPWLADILVACGAIELVK